jgi:hypothetical protein
VTAHGEGPYSFPASNGILSGDLLDSHGYERFPVNFSYSFVDVLYFRPILPTALTGSAPLGRTTFAVSQEDQRLITIFDISAVDLDFVAMSSACISDLFIASVREPASVQLRYLSILSFSSMPSTHCFVRSTSVMPTTFDIPAVDLDFRRS